MAESADADFLNVTSLPAVMVTQTTMAEAADADFLNVTSLPEVVVTQILYYLEWEDKLNIAKSIPQWRFGLHTASAWPIVIYSHEEEENIYFVKEKRLKLLYCIKQFGKHIKSLHVNFSYKMGHTGLKILHAVHEFCTDLKSFHIKQEIAPKIDESMVWGKCIITAVCDILQASPGLRSAGIKQPFIDWSDSPDNNMTLCLLRRKLGDKVTHLELSPESLWEHEGLLNILSKFTNLRVLVVRREVINNELILNMVRNGLHELTIYQEEEIPLAQQADLQTNYWEEVLKICPHFKLNLILRYIVVIKDSFPAKMPIYSLILDDLVNNVTKGVIDHLAQTYKDTLQHFTYTNSLLKNFETGDRRLPSALVDMVTKCTKLHTLQYGFPLSSTAIILIAKSRKLKKFAISSREVSYEYDWPANARFSEQEVQDLKDSGSSECKLEMAVSKLLGFDWKLTDPYTLYELSYLTM